MDTGKRCDTTYFIAVTNSGRTQYLQSKGMTKMVAPEINVTCTGKKAK